MSTPSAPYLCAVCGAPVLAGARFCASCGTPFSERPPLRVTGVPPSTPGATVPSGTVPLAAPPPSYGPPPGRPAPLVPDEPEPTGTSPIVWVAIVALVFIVALVGAYLLFAERPARGDAAPDVVVDIEAPAEPAPPPASADEGLDDGSFPSDPSLFDLGPPPPDEGAGLDTPPPATPEPPPAEPPPSTEPPPSNEPPSDAERRTNEPPASPRLAAAWAEYQRARAAVEMALRRGASVASACEALVAAGDAVLRLPGRERYVGEITRDRRVC